MQGKRLPLAAVDHPALRQGTAPVSDPAKVQPLLADMLVTMPAEGGVGLAAPQVGRAERVFVTAIGPRRVFINPEILHRSLDEADFEGCLSIPRLFGEVRRAKSIVVRALDASGNEFTVEASDLYARVIQHELDHLDGLLFADHVEKPNSMYEISEAEWTNRKEDPRES